MRIIRETVAQDLIEYALLTALIGLLTLVTWPSIQAGIQQHYIGWGTGIQQRACTPNPLSSPIRPGVCEPSPGGIE